MLRRETMVADEDSLAFAYTMTGTHKGLLMGIPQGKKIGIRGVQISKFRDGKMVERWGSSDQLCMPRSWVLRSCLTDEKRIFLDAFSPPARRR